MTRDHGIRLYTCAATQGRYVENNGRTDVVPRSRKTSEYSRYGEGGDNDEDCCDDRGEEGRNVGNAKTDIKP